MENYVEYDGVRYLRKKFIGRANILVDLEKRERDRLQTANKNPLKAAKAAAKAKVNSK